MDDAHAVIAMRYVERNPIWAKMRRVPWTYRWSSAAAHTSRPAPAHLLDLEAWNDLVPGVNWKEMLREGDDKEILAALRLNTRTGCPLARDSFLSKLERTLVRRLRPLPVGRPKKQQSETRKRRK